MCNPTVRLLINRFLSYILSYVLRTRPPFRTDKNKQTNNRVLVETDRPILLVNNTKYHQ